MNIGDGVNVSLNGDNPIHLDVTGDATINAVLDANGSVGNGVYQSVFKTGNLGGGSGGKAWSDNTNFINVSPKHGTGPTHLVGSSPFNSGGSRKKGGTLNGLVAGTAAGVVDTAVQVREAKQPGDLTIRVPTQFLARLMVISMWMLSLPDLVAGAVRQLTGVQVQEPSR